MPRQHKGSLLRAERQGEATMKQQAAILIATIVIGAALAAILVMRKDLCEVGPNPNRPHGDCCLHGLRI